MNVLLVAEESAGIQVLRGLARTQNRLVAVMTAPPSRGGGATVATVAETLGVPVLPSERVKDARLAEWIREHEVDLLLNVHSLYVIDAAVVAAPAIGSFNLHPGPLPEYAGLNAPSWAIYRGETRHAVTVHWMEPGIDTGPIAYESPFELTEEDTGLSVSARCVREGVPLFARLLEDAEGGRDAIPALPQDLSRRRYYAAGAPDDGRIAWSRPAREIVDFVRACDYFPFPSPWGHPMARLDERAIGVTKAALGAADAGGRPGSVEAVEGEAAVVSCGDGRILVSRLLVDGKPVAAAELLRPGVVLADG